MEYPANLPDRAFPLTRVGPPPPPNLRLYPLPESNSGCSVFRNIVAALLPFDPQGQRKLAGGDRAFEYMKCVRWPNGKVSCPRCGSEKVSIISTRKLWTCSECKTKKQFTIKVGTILEDSALPFEKWICAFWLIANAKNGISSHEIGRSLGVTQRTGWFMLQRIRLAMQNGTIVKVGGEVEVDETWIGGKSRNMHLNKRRARVHGKTGGLPVSLAKVRLLPTMPEMALVNLPASVSFRSLNRKACSSR